MMSMTTTTISSELLDELFVRFFTDVSLYNHDMSKCFWQLEKMYWYHIDLLKSNENPSKVNMKLFLDNIKHYLIHILPEGIDIDNEYEKWMDSRKSIPRCKVILLDEEMENVVLVKCANNDYVIFPGGKVEETDRDLVETAIRETYEEIGLDIRDKIDPDSYFDFDQYGVKNRYFVIRNVNKNTYFHPNVINEILYIKWFPIRDIPDNVATYNLNRHSVRLIKDSIKSLKSFIAHL